MNLTDAIEKIRTHLKRMDSLYGEIVFDEWAVLATDRGGVTRIVAYSGPREAEFSKQVPEDARALREAGERRTYEIGDFEFVHDAHGASLDAFIRTGRASFLVCNHTAGTMEKVRASSRWKQAQPAWFNLTEAFRASPLEG
jgi:hypothetical protein